MVYGKPELYPKSAVTNANKTTMNLHVSFILKPESVWEVSLPQQEEDLKEQKINPRKIKSAVNREEHKVCKNNLSSPKKLH